MINNHLVIDVHNHYLPQEVAGEISLTPVKSPDFRPQGKLPKIAQQTRDIENRLQIMDEAGVDMAVLGGAASNPQGIDMYRKMNDLYAAVAKSYPDRFIPCSHIPLEGDPQSLQELERTVNDYGFKAVTLVSSTQDKTLDSEALYPLWTKISQLDIAIIMHPSVREPLWGGEKYRMSSHVSREYDICKAAVEVMYGVLKEFPDLKFVIPHHGGGLTNLLGRVIAWFEPEGWNVPDDIRGLPKTPREIEQLGLDVEFKKIFDNLYFDTAGFGGWMPITESTVSVVRADRICFGTDYPFEIHETQDIRIFIEGIIGLDISEQDKDNILGGNIKRVLRL